MPLGYIAHSPICCIDIHFAYKGYSPKCYIHILIWNIALIHFTSMLILICYMSPYNQITGRWSYNDYKGANKKGLYKPPFYTLYAYPHIFRLVLIRRIDITNPVMVTITINNNICFPLK